MFYAYVVAFAVTAAALSVPSVRVGRAIAYLRARSKISNVSFFTALATLAASHAASLRLLEGAFASRVRLVAVEHAFPVKIMGFRDSYKIAGLFGDTLTAIAIVQMFALAIVALAMLEPSRLRWAGAVACGALLALLTIGMRTGTSGDMYSNVGYALLGARSYAPPNAPFAGGYAPISGLWGSPLVPSPYGPLWLAIDRAATFFGGDLYAKIVCLRVLDVVSIAAVAGLLAALRVPAPAVALVIVNPALAFEFVANVHNDMLAVALLLGARLAAERGSRIAAVALAASAGLVKIPFALFSAASFTSLAKRRDRVAALAAAIAIAVLISYADSRGAFFAALLHHANEHVGAGGPTSVLLSIDSLMRAVSVAALIALSFAGFWNGAVVYAMPLVGVELLPWYLVWAIPYAALRARALAAFLVVLPVMRIAVDTTLASGEAVLALQRALFACFVGATALFALRRFRRRAA